MTVAGAAGVTALSLQIYELVSDPPSCSHVSDIAVRADGGAAFAWDDHSVVRRGRASTPGVLRYDVSSETVDPYLTTTPVVHLALPAGAAGAGFLTQLGQAALFPFDAGQASPVPRSADETILGPPIPLGGPADRQPLGVACADGATRVFVLVADGALEYRVVVLTGGPAALAVAADVPVYTAATEPLRPRIAAAPDGSAAYAYDGTSGNLYRVALADETWNVGPALALGVPAIAEILVSPNGETVWIAGQIGLQTVFFVVDTMAWTVRREPLAEPTTTLAVHSMALTPDGRRIVVTDTTRSAIRLIDAVSLRFLQTVGAGGRSRDDIGAPGGIAVAPDQSRLFVAAESGSIVVAEQVRPPLAASTAGADRAGVPGPPTERSSS